MKPRSKIVKTNRVGSVNPFAVLDSDEEDQTQHEPVEDNTKVVSDSPVNYAIKDIHWSRDKAILELKNFNVQNIKKDRVGILHLQFERESEGAKVLEWMRQKHGLKFNATKVPLRTDPKCFICYKDGHWGPNCKESLLASFPHELVCLIGSYLHISELLRFKSVRKSYNTAIKTMRSLTVRNPFYDEYDTQFMKLKYNFLKTFRSLEELTLLKIEAEQLVNAEFNTIDFITQCKSLRSLTLRSRESMDPQLLSKIFSLTALTKLIVIGCSMQQQLSQLTNLTDLGLSVTTDDPFDDTLDMQLTRLPALKRLELKNFYRWDEVARLVLSAENLTRLVALKTRGFRHGIVFGTEMNRLEELDTGYIREWYPLIAPNLTRLVCKNCPKINDSINNDFVKLKHLTLGLGPDKEVFLTRLALPNLETLKLSKWISDVDVSGCTNLKNLVVEALDMFILQVPPSITDVTINPCYAAPQTLKAISELPSLKHLKISQSYTPDDDIKVLAQITTLQTLSFNRPYTAHEGFMESLARFTQVKVLDLVHQRYWQKNYYNEKAVLLILKLSEKLPNTRILHGVQFYHDTLLPIGCKKFNEYCACPRCLQGRQRQGELAEDKKIDKNEPETHLPAKFNKFWYT